MLTKSSLNSAVVLFALLFFSSHGLVAVEQAKVKLPVKSVTVDARMIDTEYSTDYTIIAEEELKKSGYLELLTGYTRNAMEYLKLKEEKKGKLKIYISLQITRTNKMRLEYVVRAFEGEKEKWRVSSSCFARHSVDVREILPALVAGALAHIGQDKQVKAYRLDKFPQYVNAVVK